MKPMDERLAEAWQLKVDLDWEGCLALIAELKSRLAIAPGNLGAADVQRLLQNPERKAILDVLVLQSSLSRQSGNAEYADFLLAQLEVAFENGLVERSFRFSHERGLQNLLCGHFSAALEDFLRASGCASSSLEKLWATINVIFCLDNLGLPWAKTMVQFQSLLAELKGYSNLKRVTEQYAAFLARIAFREGRLPEFFSTPLEPATGFGQGRYLRSLVSLLPYHTYYEPRQVENSLEELLSVSPALRYSSFRLRTLRGLLSPEDAEIEKPSEWVDRLYVWTWRWLTNPREFGVEKTLQALKALDLTKFIHRLTAEDQLQLRNAVLWLGLFDRSGQRLVESLCAKIPGAQAAGYPLFQIENYAIHYLYAVRDKNRILQTDYADQLEHHPLWKSKSLCFRELIRGVDTGSSERPALQPLVSNLHRLCHPPVEPRRGLQIDLDDHAILSAGKNQRIVSAPLTAAFEVLSRNPILTCEEFIAVTFGIHRYDPVIHAPKIFNLLARLKLLAPSGLTFRVKEGRVIADGSWDQIQFLSRKKAGLNLGHHPEWKDWLQQSAPLPSSGNASPPPKESADQAFEKVTWKTGATRQEIENAIGRPRSTVNRLLSSWVKAGKIIKNGQSRQTRYYLRGTHVARH